MRGTVVDEALMADGALMSVVVLGELRDEGPGVVMWCKELH